MAHTTPTSLKPATTSTESSPGPDSIEDGIIPSVPRAKSTPRKGHTKSRRGCLNCKRRRVKCQETLPVCEHCKRLGLPCQYPRAGVTTPSSALQTTPTQFSIDDLRFFHHFLVTAYPPLPIDGGAIWKEVATLSHSVCLALFVAQSVRPNRCRSSNI